MGKRNTSQESTFRLTPDIHKRIMKLVLSGVPIKLVYGAIGCRTSDVHTWMADGQREADRRAKGDPVERGVIAMDYLNSVYRLYCDVTAAVDILTAKISTVPVKVALKGDWHAAKWLLERRAPDIFHEKKQDKPDGDHDAAPKVTIYMPENGRGPAQAT